MLRPALASAAASAVALLLAPSSLVSASSPFPPQPDYLRMPDPRGTFVATFSAGSQPGTYVLTNGLATRVFASTSAPDGSLTGFGTIDYRLDAGGDGGTSFLRGLGPEARLYLDADTSTGVDVGGFIGQTEYLVYYQDFAPPIATNPLAMSPLSVTSGPTVAPYEWVPRYGAPNASWPPSGVHVVVTYGPPAASSGSGFVQLNNTGLGCDAPLTCLTGFYLCDNSSVPGQCTFPRENATQFCGLWDECVGVTCNDGRSDCQARSSLAEPYSSGFTSYAKPGWFTYPDLRVEVHYEVYDGIPAMAKWLNVYINGGPANGPGPLLNAVSIEVLHVPWELRGRLHAEEAYIPSVGERNSYEAAGWYPADGANFTGLTSSPFNLWVYDEDEKGPWGPDGAWQYYYDQGVNETMLDARYAIGPGLNVTNRNLTTFRLYEILHDTDDLDRQGLARKKLLRTAAPAILTDLWPAYMVGGDSASIRNGADMASQAGFRALHTQTDPFDFSPAHIAQVRSDIAYVHSKGLLAAFYVLLQNPPGMTPEEQAIDPVTGQGEGVACFATSAHAQFLANIANFTQMTGFDFLDTDGPFEAYPCASESHDRHRDLYDSQVRQWEENVAWYRTLPTAPNPLSLAGSGIIVTCPDPYEFASGTIGQPIGYTDRWGSVGDRWEWLLMGRVYAYDGTLWKSPTNGLMPFDLNRAGPMSSADDLNWLDNGFSVFVGLAGRNFQNGALWQNAASQAIVMGWAGVMTKYRSILNADIIHLRKPTGRSWDAVLHADPQAPQGEPKGFALLWNPTLSPIVLNTTLSVYYCGFAPGGPAVSALWKDGTQQQLTVDMFFGVPVARTLAPQSYDWVVLS
jgi:hypothetical protein